MGIAGRDVPGGLIGARTKEVLLHLASQVLARALIGQVEPVFVDDIATMPQAIIDNARDGDVVICMGAGSIGGVPAQVLQKAGAA